MICNCGRSKAPFPWACTGGSEAVFVYCHFGRWRVTNALYIKSQQTEDSFVPFCEGYKQAMWHKTGCWMKEMHTHKINQGNLSGLQMDIFNRIQTERQKGFFFFLHKWKNSFTAFYRHFWEEASIKYSWLPLVDTSLADGVVVSTHLAPKLSHFPFPHPVNLWLSVIGADGKW